ncbi:MAG: hypothetical protein ACRC46_06775 [Thermoguttaceae bacterium]
MKSKRNIIMVAVAVAFFAWYGGSWCWQTFYRQPRQELGDKIAQLENAIATGQQNLAAMQQFSAAQSGYYYRSLPLQPEAARSLYQFWLLELLQFCDIEQPTVEVAAPQRSETGGYVYRASIRGRATLGSAIRFLYEFSWAPFLHRVTMLSLTPQEKGDAVEILVTLDALAIPRAVPTNPYPLLDQLPSGFVTPRLASPALDAYQLVIERNLLREVKGGIDAADYAYMTGVNNDGGTSEIWMTLRLDDSVSRFHVGDKIEYGSFSGTLVSIQERDAIINRGGIDWLITAGERLTDAFPLPPELAPK